MALHRVMGGFGLLVLATFLFLGGLASADTPPKQPPSRPKPPPTKPKQPTRPKTGNRTGVQQKKPVAGKPKQSNPKQTAGKPWAGKATANKANTAKANAAKSNAAKAAAARAQAARRLAWYRSRYYHRHGLVMHRLQVRHPGWKNFGVVRGKSAAAFRRHMLHMQGWSTRVGARSQDRYLIQGRMRHWRTRGMSTYRPSLVRAAHMWRRMGYQARVL